MKRNLILTAAILMVACAAGAAPEIIVDRAGPDIFPESWLTAKVAAKAELLSEEEQPRCKEILDRALTKYPAGALDGSLKKVYVLGGLAYSGISAAGSSSASAIYIVDRHYTAAQIEDLFHAELSSLLLRKFPSHLDQAAWQQINPPDFTYLGSGVQAVKEKKASLQWNEALHEDGFLKEYGKASVEEDFNGYAARLLMGDDRLWRAIEKYPRVKAKAELTMAFYKQLSPGLTPEFFASLRQPPAK